MDVKTSTVVTVVMTAEESIQLYKEMCTLGFDHPQCGELLDLLGEIDWISE